MSERFTLSEWISSELFIIIMSELRANLSERFTKDKRIESGFQRTVSEIDQNLGEFNVFEVNIILIIFQTET